MQTFTQEDWDVYARCYDALLGLRPYTDMLGEVVDRVTKLPTHCILDASCGTGNFEAFMCDMKTSDFRIIGIDMAGAMLERARTKCRKHSQCGFEAANLNEPLSFKSASFAQVVSLNTIYAVQSPEATLREFHRVLEDGGYLTVVTPRWDYENGIILKEHCGSTLPDIYWANVHQSESREEKLIREAITDEKIAGDMLAVARFNRNIAGEKEFYFYHPEELVSLLKKVGFEVLHLSYTYAGQDIFITAQKGARHADRLTS